MDEGRRPRVWERWVAAVLLGILAGLGAANAAEAEQVVAGNLVVAFDFDSAPSKLPRSEDVPIRFSGSAEIGTKDGSVPPPLEHLRIEFDKFGHLETRGLPTCTRAKLVATTPAHARRLCPGAIVGTGTGSGVVTFPEQAPIPASSPVTFFNGPEIDGDPSVIVHAYLTVPVPTTYLVPVRIERIHKGIYGFRVEADIPRIAGGFGSIADFHFEVGRKWSFDGSRLSYVYARCPTARLQALIETDFRDGTHVLSHFVHPCQPR